jgi:ubiquinol-cytochrome c reductase iron-sulfur subunit
VELDGSLWNLTRPFVPQNPNVTMPRELSPPTRRDVLFVATGSMAAVGGALATWPLIAHMNPAAGVEPQSVLVDLAPVRPGQAITVAWRNQPIVIRHRTADEIARARATAPDILPDPYARNAALPAKTPATDANRTNARHPQWLVVVGLCTHLGCRLLDRDLPEGVEGWFCPCHAARFDLSGRVRGGPALTNLPVPPWRFVGARTIEIGRA